MYCRSKSRRDLAKSPAQVAINWLVTQPNGRWLPRDSGRDESGAACFDNLGSLDFAIPADQRKRLTEVGYAGIRSPLQLLHARNSIPRQRKYYRCASGAVATSTKAQPRLRQRKKPAPVKSLREQVRELGARFPVDGSLDRAFAIRETAPRTGPSPPDRAVDSADDHGGNRADASCAGRSRFRSRRVRWTSR